MVLGGGHTLALALGLHWLPWQTWLAGFGFITVGALDDRHSFLPRQKVLVLLTLSALAAWPWLGVLSTTGLPLVPTA